MRFDLTISSAEALDRIASMVDESRLFNHFRYTGEKPFLGRIEGNRFYAFKKIEGRNSFNPKLTGMVISKEEGCEVNATIEIPKFVSYFSIAWFIGVIIFLIIGLLLFLSGYFTKSLEPALFMAVIVPLGMLLFGGCLLISGNRFCKKYKEQLHNALMDLFEDCMQDGIKANEA